MHKNLHDLKMFKIISFSIVISFVFCIMFISSSSIPKGDDLVFHLNRINSLSYSLQNGDFYPYIFHNQNFGYGYASPIFYSILFLYPASFLNCLGFSVIESYKIMILLCTFLTCLTTAYFLTAFTKNTFSISVGIIFYIFSGYRITDCYTRGALGEIFAFIFLPLILYGIFDIFYDTHKKWRVLTIGYTGLLLSHNISFFLGCCLFLSFFSFNVKKTVTNQQIRFSLYKAISFSIGLTAFFLFPMLEQINILTIANNIPPSSEVLKLQDILGLLNGTYIYTPGIITILIPFMQFRKLKKYPFLKHCYIIGIFSILLTMFTALWNIPALGFIQFPWRLILLSCILMIPSFVFIFEQLKYSRKMILLIMELIFIIYYFNAQSSLPLLSNISDPQLNIDKLVTTFGDDVNFCSSELAHGEYLPNKEYDYRFSKRKINTNPSAMVEIPFTEKYNEIIFNSLSTAKPTTYIIPLTYYKGYIIEINNTTLYPYPDCENAFVTFVLDDNYADEEIKISYKGTRIQKLSSLLSIMTSIIFGAFLLNRKYKQRS